MASWNEHYRSDWQWQHGQNHPYLVCQLLADWPHGFFSQRSWPAPPEELTPTLSAQAQVYRIQQVHGKVVRSTLELTACAVGDDSRPLEPADGLISAAATEAVWVCSADCTPALIADQRTGQVAAIHAGWRGTAAGIVPEAIAKLLAQGSQLADLRVALGPAIAGEVYQVTEAVAAETLLSLSNLHHSPLHHSPLHHSALATDEAQASSEAAISEATIPPTDTAAPSQRSLLDHYLDLPQKPILPDPEPDKVKLDVRRVNVMQLEQLGLQPEQISVAPHCTYGEPEHFFSYRRTGEKKVQWSGIVSRAVV